MPKIKISKKSKDDRTDIELTLKHYIAKEKAIKTKKIEIKSKDEILITCIDEESTKAATKYLNNKMNNICKIEEEQLKIHIIKIIGVESIFCENQNTLEYDINTRNFNNLQSNGKILSINNNQKTKKASIIMEVTADIHNYIKENRSILFIAYQNCRVYDVVNIKPCLKCGVLGHNHKRCKNNINCLKCAGAHSTKDCTEIVKRCVNCCYANNKYNKNYNINHIATDSDECEILKSKIRNYITTTDYIIKPDLPRYGAKLENFKNVYQESNSQETQEIINASGDNAVSTATTPVTRLRFGSSSSLGSTKM